MVYWVRVSVSILAVDPSPASILEFYLLCFLGHSCLYFYLLACLDAPLACQFHVDMSASRFFFFSVIVNFATTNLKIKFPSTHESFNFRYV